MLVIPSMLATIKTFFFMLVFIVSNKIKSFKTILFIIMLPRISLFYLLLLHVKIKDCRRNSMQLRM